MPSKTLPPFGSRHLAACAMQAKFPASNGRIRKPSKEVQAKAASLVKELREGIGHLRKLSLMIAQVECELKELVNYNDGLEIEGTGIVYWTADKKGRRVGKTNWMKLVKDHKISAETLKKYQEADEARRFFLHAKAHLPEGISTMDVKMTQGETVNLEEDL